MKVNSIEFKKHSIFHDLFLNFENDNDVYGKIIFAGENGTGKSLLLEMINYIYGTETERVKHLLKDTVFVMSIDEKEREQLINHQYEPMRGNLPIFPNSFIDNKLTVIDGFDVWYVNTKNNLEKFPYHWHDLDFIKFSSYINGREDSSSSKKNKNSRYCSVDSFDYDVDEIILGLWRKDINDHINKAMNNDIGIKFELPRIDSINKVISKYFNDFNGFKIEIEDSIEYPQLTLDFRGVENLDINYLSSGEKQLLAKILFICQKVRSNSIILIDEPEQNLHPKWQSEILDIYDDLLNSISSERSIQYFVATHSPFIIHHDTKLDEKTFVLQSNGVHKTIAKEPKFYNWSPEDIIEKAFDVRVINENTISKDNKTIVLTEGKTDLIHIKNAFHKLNLSIKELIFHELPEGEAGDIELFRLAKAASKIPRKNKVIFIFDRDNKKITSEFSSDFPYRDFGNNVYAFCIPTPQSRIDYTNISIEFYYSDEDIKKNHNGKSLYFDNEVTEVIVKATQQIKIEKLDEIIHDKEFSKKIFDVPNMCKSSDWMHSKTTFANLIADNHSFNKNIKYDNFKLIYNVILEILKI